MGKFSGVSAVPDEGACLVLFVIGVQVGFERLEEDDHAIAKRKCLDGSLAFGRFAQRECFRRCRQGA